MDDEGQVNHIKLVTVLFEPLQSLWSRRKEILKYPFMNKNTYRTRTGIAMERNYPSDRGQSGKSK